MIRQINRNFNVYDATKQGYKAELPELDFTKVQAREQARVNAEIARKQDLAKLQDTGLYNIFDSDVRRDVEALTKDVAEGRLDPKSQEYYNRYTSIGGKTKRYKTVSDQINNVYESYLKDPSKFVWNDADGNVYTGQEGMNMWRESLNQSSPEGMSFEEISTMAIEPARNLDSRIDLDTTKTQAYGKNLFENFAKNNDLQYSEMAGGEIVLLAQDKELPKGYREELKANLITAFAKPISQNYGIMKAQNSLPTYPAGHKNEGQPMTPEDYAKDFADKQIPNIVSTSEFRNKKGRAELANLNARTAKLNKELKEPDLAPVNYGGNESMTKEELDAQYTQKLKDSGYTDDEIAKALETRKYLSDSVEGIGGQNTLVPQSKMTTTTDKGEMLVSEYVYDPKGKKFYKAGVVPQKGSKKITTTTPQFGMVDGEMMETGSVSVLDYAAMQTESYKQESDREGIVSDYMRAGMSREKANEQVDLLIKKPEQAQNNENTSDFSNRKEGETWSEGGYDYKVVNGKVLRKPKK